MLNHILDELMAHRAHIYNTFDFYAVMGSGSDITQIQLNQFTDLLDDCGIPDKNSVTCNRAALDRVFIATNREDDQDDATAEANDDSSLMRFEFIEIFIPSYNSSNCTSLASNYATRSWYFNFDCCRRNCSCLVSRGKI